MDGCIDHDRQVVGQALGNNPKDLLMDLLTLISMFNRSGFSTSTGASQDDDSTHWDQPERG